MPALAALYTIVAEFEDNYITQTPPLYKQCLHHIRTRSQKHVGPRSGGLDQIALVGPNFNLNAKQSNHRGIKSFSLGSSPMYYIYTITISLGTAIDWTLCPGQYADGATEVV